MSNRSLREVGPGHHELFITVFTAVAMAASKQTGPWPVATLQVDILPSEHTGSNPGWLNNELEDTDQINPRPSSTTETL